MKVILTNDDGVDAPGLAALGEVGIGPSVIVAPQGPLLGCSHRVTTFDGPIRVKREVQSWAGEGRQGVC